MDLSNLQPAKGSIKKSKRIGRGQGSGRGGTSTKGHKGQKSRSGYSRKKGFEGGQMPLQRRVPKFGFTNPNRRVFKAVNLGDLQKLHAKYENLEVIGLPCNQFLFQEPFSEDTIQKFCSLNYGVDFLMTKKINVKGKNQHQLYSWLTKKELNNKKNSKVKWNFQKYLISPNGELIDVFPPRSSPLSEEITKHL